MKLAWMVVVVLGATAAAEELRDGHYAAALKACKEGVTHHPVPKTQAALETLADHIRDEAKSHNVKVE